MYLKNKMDGFWSAHFGLVHFPPHRLLLSPNGSCCLELRPFQAHTLMSFFSVTRNHLCSQKIKATYLHEDIDQLCVMYMLQHLKQLVCMSWTTIAVESDSKCFKKYVWEAYFGRNIILLKVFKIDTLRLRLVHGTTCSLVACWCLFGNHCNSCCKIFSNTMQRSESQIKEAQKYSPSTSDVINELGRSR